MQSSRQSDRRVGEVTAAKGALGASFLILFLGFVTFALFFAQPRLSFAQVDKSSWMAQYQPVIETVPLKGIAIPGTHDTFSYVAASSALYAIDLTERLDIPGQLKAGVRHFDMRTLLLDSNGKGCNSDPFALPFSGAGYYMFIHSNNCTGVKLSDVLDQISSFLDSHPQEIILLHFAGSVSTGNPNYASSAAFETVLDQHLRRASDGASYIFDAATACKLAGLPWTQYPPGVYFPTAQYAGFCVLQGPTSQGITSQGVPPQEVTPQQLYTTSARVILVEKFGLTGTGSFNDSARLTWADGNGTNLQNGPIENLRGYYEAAFSGTSDPSLLDSWLEMSTPDGLLGLYGKRPVGAGYESDPLILTLQANLTPFGACDTECQYFFLGAPLLFAAVYNPQLAGLLATSPLGNTWSTHSVNVVQVDFVEWPDNETLCLSNPTPLNCRTVVDDITSFNDQTFGRVPFGLYGASEIAVGHDGSVYKLGYTGTGSGALGQNYPLAKLTGNTGQFTDWTDLPFGGG